MRHSSSPATRIDLSHIHSGGGSIVHFRFFLYLLKIKKKNSNDVRYEMCLKNRNFLDVALEFTRHSPKTPSPRFIFIFSFYIYFCVLILEIQKKKQIFF